jgi:hypothetical protein
MDRTPETRTAGTIPSVLGSSVLIDDAPLGIGEYLMGEELPLSTIFRAVAELLRERDDVVIFGAHAVNAYATVERMTEDIDVLSTDAAGLAEHLRRSLSDRFRVAIRVREVVPGEGFRVYQIRTPKNRHLIDVRRVDVLPPFEIRDGLRIAAPLELVVMKTIALAGRRARPKGGTDLADIRRLLLAFPELQRSSAVADRLVAIGAGAPTLAVWSEIASTPIEPDDADDADE